MHRLLNRNIARIFTVAAIAVVLGFSELLFSWTAFAQTPPVNNLNTGITNIGITQGSQAGTAITGLTLSSEEPGTLTINWDAASPTPNDYRVAWARGDQEYISYTETDKDGNNYPTTNSLTLTGLDQGVEYKVQVRARYNGDSGPWSSEVRRTVASEPSSSPTPTPQNTPTAQPQNTPTPERSISGLTLSSDEPGTLTIDWNAASPTPNDYRVAWARGDEDYTSHTETDKDGNDYPTTNSLTLSDLEQGVEYKVQVRARYNGDSGPWSGEVRLTVASGTESTATPVPESTATPAAQDDSTPGKVQNLQAAVSSTVSGDNPQALAHMSFGNVVSKFLSAGVNSQFAAARSATRGGKSTTIINYDNTVTLVWIAPENGPRPDGYRIYRAIWTDHTYPNRWTVLVSDTGNTDVTYTDTTVEDYTRYSYKVSALIGDIEGPTSNVIHLTTNPHTEAPSAPNNLQATESETMPGTIEVTWERPEYVGETTITTENVTTSDDSVEPSETSYSATDTDTGVTTDYTETVTVVFDAVNNKYIVTTTTVAIRTEVPCSYTIMRGSVYDDRHNVLSENISNLSYTDVGLQSRTTNYYFVWATCGGHTGSSQSVRLTTRRVDVPVPSIQASYTDSGATRIVWTINEPAMPAIEEFKIYRSGDFKYYDHRVFKDIDYRRIQKTVPSDGSGSYDYIDKNVLEGLPYNYFIEAIDVNNNRSSTATIRVIARKALDRPGAVQNFRVTNDVIGSVRLEWEAQADTEGGVAEYYRIDRQRIQPSDGHVEKFQTDASATSFVDDTPNLVPGARYRYAMAAFNAAGQGMASTAIVNVRVPENNDNNDNGDNGDNNDNNGDNNDNNGDNPTYQPPPNAPTLTEATRPARVGASISSAMRETADDNSTTTLTVDWIDGTAGVRVCHERYYVFVSNPDPFTVVNVPPASDAIKNHYFLPESWRDNLVIESYGSNSGQERVRVILGDVSTGERTFTLTQDDLINIVDGLLYRGGERVHHDVIPVTLSDRVNVALRIVDEQADDLDPTLHVWCGHPILLESVSIGEVEFPVYVPNE